MKTIWKFQLGVHDEQDVKMPVGSRILSVGVQRGTPCLWAMVDEDAADGWRRIHMRGTGHPAGDVDGAEFLGTIQLLGGDMILHVFAEVQP